MEDSRNNKVEFSGDVSNSTIEVNQNQDGNQAIANKNIEYEIDDTSYRVISSKPADKANKFFAITIGISVLAIIADIAGVLTYIGINEGMMILVLFPIVLVIAMFTKQARWLHNLPKNNTALFKDGRWYEKLEDGNIAIYLKKGKCIFPKCKGIINIVSAPPREHPNHTLIGKCSLGEVQHTYTVDFNGIGYPHQFDWRLLPQERNKA